MPVPVFTKPLKDLSAEEGECMVLECRLTSDPNTKVAWFREGDPIEDSPDFRILHKGEISTLVIGSAYPEDSGTFECVAFNNAGSASTSCKLTVTGGGYYSVSTKSPSATTKVVVNRPRVVIAADTETSQSHHPSENHLPSASGNSSRVSSRSQTPAVTVTPPPEDSTKESIVATIVTTHYRSPSPAHTPTMPYSPTHAMNNVDANHNFEKEKDSLVQDLSDKLSTNDVLPKNADGNAPRDYILSPTLTDPNTTLKPQEYRISPFEQRLINEVEYRLERTPPVNEDPQDAVFEQVAADEQRVPFFRNGVGNFRLADGSPMKFLCRIGGAPKPKLYWFKDGKQISKRSQHYFQSDEGDGAFSLNIPRSCPEDEGNYTALALNPKGRATCTGRLVIITHNNNVHLSAQDYRAVSAPKMPEKGTLAEDEESPVEKYFRPVFVQKPSNVSVQEGKLVRLDVKVTGLPAPSLSWLINGRPVQQDFSHKILVRENNVHSLLLDPVSTMDEGMYSVVARNKAGEATVNVSVTVIPQERISVPLFVQRLTSQTVAEGGSVRLEARVVGSPAPAIFWKKGSEEVIHSDRTQIFQDNSGYVCLLITEAYKWDSEWYTCSASNKAGNVSCRCKLDVYCPLSEAPHRQKRIRTPHRYANLAKVAGVDMREALSHDAQSGMVGNLPESDDL